MDTQKKFKINHTIEDVNFQEAPFFKLNDDCMRYVFSFLQMKQRIQIQRVCKTWQRVSQLPWNDVKILDLTARREYAVYLGLDVDAEKLKYDLPILKQTLNLCGSSVTHMILPDFQITTSSDLLILIKKMCPSLRSLDFRGVMITRKTAQFVAENFSELNQIKIQQCWPKCEDSLAKFFANNKRLKSIDIFGSDRITGVCLLGLPESLTKITISRGDNIQPELFCNALKKLKNLRTLTIGYNSDKLLSKLDSFIDALPDKLNIEELDLRASSSDRAEKLIHIKNIPHLTNLRKLVLSGNLVLHDEILVSVGTHCKNLKIVHLHCSNRVKNSAWQSFTATLNLEELKVDDLSQLPDKFFASMDMPSLKILKCYKCYKLNAKTFKKLIAKLDNLERLHIYRCGQGTSHNDIDPLIKKVLIALQNRNNGKTLEMHILNDEKIRQVRNISPLILIKEIDRSVW